MSRAPHDLVQALCSTETCRPSANDEDINIAVQRERSAMIGEAD